MPVTASQKIGLVLCEGAVLEENGVACLDLLPASGVCKGEGDWPTRMADREGSCPIHHIGKNMKRFEGLDLW